MTKHDSGDAAADPKLVHQIQVKQFSSFRDTFMPILDNPLLSGRAREAAQSLLITARYSSSCFPHHKLLILRLPHVLLLTLRGRLIRTLNVAKVTFRSGKCCTGICIIAVVLDNPLPSGRAHEAAQSMLITARNSS